MNSKRILSMVLLCSNVLAAPISSIVDMPEGWSKPAVTEAVENDVLTSESNLIRPMEQLTRAEMAQGITNAFGATQKADLSEFTDVPTTKWYYDAMSKAVRMGIISGYGNGLIKPEKKITREEMFMIIYNALELEEGSVYLLNKFNDRNLVSDWAEKAAARMVQNNYIAGNAKGNLKPTENITREEFAQVMKNIFAEYYSAPGTYTDVPEGNVIISKPGVEIKDATVTGDLVIADGVGTGEVTLNNVTVQGRTLVRGGGENSIKLINNTTLNGKVIVNNNIGKVRIYNSKSTVRNVEVKTPIILEGEFSNVEVKKATEVETKGNINNLILNEKTEVKVTSGEVKQIQVKDTAAKTTIEGSGKVTQVNANANDVTVTVSKAKVTAGQKTTGVIAGKKEVVAGKTETVKNTSSSSGGGGGGGSSSSSKVTLIYNANGGTGAPTTQTYSGKNYTFTINAIQPTRAGYKFLGWADSATATSANIESTVTVSSGSKTIYAVWGCEVCSKVNCTKEHVWCEACEDYDCGKTHTTCDKCGEVDCTKEHVWAEVYGDIDGNGEVTEEDATLLLYYVMFGEEYEVVENVETYGDADNDGALTTDDSITILYYVRGNINELPHEHNYIEGNCECGASNIE